MDNEYKISIEPRYVNSQGSFKNGLILLYDNLDKLWVFLDKKGNVVIKCDYQMVGTFHEGLALVKNNDNLYGYIDENGKEVIKCQYKVAGDFHEGLAVVANDDDLYGYIDFTGNIVIPCKYVSAFDFHEGLARVSKRGRVGFVNKNRVGFVNKNGEEVIELKYDNAIDFHEGIAAVELYTTIHDDAWTYDNPWIYIDTKGNRINKKSYSRAYEFSDGIAIAKIKMNNIANSEVFVGAINKEGKTIIPFKYEHLNKPSEGLLLATRNINSFDDYDYDYYLDELPGGFINKEGKEVIPFKYYSATDFKEGLSAVEEADGIIRYGYIDQSGKKVIKIKKCEELGAFNDGRAKITINDRGYHKFYFIDKKGNRISENIYNFATDFNEGLALVLNNNNIWSFIDTDEKEVIRIPNIYVTRNSKGETIKAQTEKELKVKILNELKKLIQTNDPVKKIGEKV